MRKTKSVIQPNEFIIFNSVPTYVYTEVEGKFKDQRLETHLTSRFIADSYENALKDAINHAKERLEQYFKMVYKDCFFGSIKIYTETIGRIGSNGGLIKRGSLVTFFEWKYDWPGTLDNYVDKFLQNPIAKSHPSTRVS